MVQVKSQKQPIVAKVAAKWAERHKQQGKALEFNCPEWAKPLLEKARYKAAHGGRSGGKSHFFAEQIVRACIADPDCRVVCIREVQKSLKFSVKSLIEQKIKDLQVEHLFTILTTEIRRKGGNGLIIFQGMQDHTADSIKSLEGFKIAWVEEAQRLSGRSLQLLRPTIRSPGSEIWFSWNPDQPEDPVDDFFRGNGGAPQEAIVVEVNYNDNPNLPPESRLEMEIDREGDADTFNHVWLGGYNVKSELQIFSGCWAIAEFEPGQSWDGPYYGADWGFGVDPTCAIEVWIYDSKLWIYRESHHYKLEIDRIAAQWKRDIPGIEKHVVRGDNSRPETINHVRTDGDGVREHIPRLTAAAKWPNSIEDGIEFIKTYDKVMIHESCRHTRDEFRLYQYKANAAGDPTSVILDKNNHLIDSLRYSISPLIQARGRAKRSGLKIY